MQIKLVPALISITVAPLSIPFTLTQAEVLAQNPKVDCSKVVTTTPELKYCSFISYQAADKKLNQVYQKVISGLKGQQRQLLVSGQLAWIKFRDNNCDFEVYPVRGGTAYEIMRDGCLERLTKQRTQDLQDYLSSR